ncbi:MAG: FAD-dependent oxidoreductase [Peptococcaceae bacterium]|nr:FAD-dependent oxidoreductase [Peptococcaceae bacterium]
MSENSITHILQPGKIGSLSLKNRIIYSAMTYKLADGKGRLTKAEVNSMLYRAKQEYGPAMIIFPGLNASLYGQPVKAVNINTDETMYSLKNQVNQFKQYNTKTVAEIGISALRPGMLFVNASQAVPGASAMRYPLAFEEMTQDEIQRSIRIHTEMAKRAKKAGFDAIKLATVLYKKILGNFLSPFTNHRTDKYGGSTENRARLLIETLQSIRKEVGENYPIIIDLKIDELLGNKGLELPEGLKIAKMIAPYVDAINPCVGCELTKDEVRSAYFTPKAYTLPYAQALKEAVPDVAIICNCKMGTPSIADEAIADNKTDFVALGRPLWVDPEWITKAATGRNNEIIHCIGCLNCYAESTHQELNPIQRACTVNPCNLREEEYYSLTPTDSPKNILVVGGGLAGMEAAATLAQRGHHVTLAEKNNSLGGQWIVASHGKEKADYRTLIPTKRRILEQSGAIIKTNCTVDKAYIQAINPDLVIVATGATPKSLSFNHNFKHINIVQGNDVLMNQATIGKRVAVIGGRFIGMEVAAKLSEEGKDVAIIDMTDLAKGANPYLTKYYNQKIIKDGVRLYPNCPVIDITDNGVDILHLGFPVTVPADTVVLAIGTQSVNNLIKDCDALNIECIPIGDAKRIGDALYAIRDGAEVGRLI